MAALAQETIRLKINNPQNHFWMRIPERPESIPQPKSRKRSPNISRRGLTVSKNISGTNDTIATNLKPYDTIQHLLDMPIFYFESNKYTYAHIVMINNSTLDKIEKTDTLHEYIKNNIIEVELGTFVNNVCPICLEQLGNDLGGENRVVAAHRATSGENCKRRHLFHLKCLSRWMETNDTCPMCRKRLRIISVRSNECLTSEDVQKGNAYFKF